MTLKRTESQARNRVLLTLWQFAFSEEKVRRSQITEKLPTKGEKVADYQPFLANLSEKGAIAITKEKRTEFISINPTEIRNMLMVGLQDESFQFGAQIGKKFANSLLRLIRDISKTALEAPSSVQISQAAKTLSYDEFQDMALEAFDRLNQDYNLDNLVPIYRIRREIGDRVNPTQFRDWLFKMQANQVLLLQGGEMLDATPDKLEDSIKSASGEIRYYASRVAA
jgi:hypothetical protein